MRVNFDPYYSIRQVTDGRHHPWTTGEMDDAFKYYDFKRQPDLIETVLEDFIPFVDYEATATFYELLRFVNGPDSVFESNDCALKFGDNHHDPNGMKKRAWGRLLILIRELVYNTNDEAVDYYLSALRDELHKLDTSFEMGAILLTKFPTQFIEIPKPPEEQEGYCGEILFWAWGNDEHETMENLARTFDNIFIAVKNVSENIRISLTKQAAKE